MRAVGEQADATPKSRRHPRKLPCGTTHIIDIVNTVLVL